MERPIACSLDDAAARDRLAEWQTALGALVTAVEWPAPNRVRMPLRDDPVALLDLARREVACCPFFEFGIEVTAEGSALTVAVPDEAAAVLRDFAALASP
ncbi:MAG TPA: hypothetical protein VGN59_02455 [Acidimicrobiia bacterium]|jgi:hypothetical protein